MRHSNTIRFAQLLEQVLSRKTLSLSSIISWTPGQGGEELFIQCKNLSHDGAPSVPGARTDRQTNSTNAKVHLFNLCIP